MTAGPEPTPPIIRARAPLRIELAGRDVYAAITLGAQVEVALGGRTIRLRAEDRDLRVTLASPAAIAYDGQLDRPKAALNMLPVTGGIEVLTRVDAPDDAGLGVSGALDLALLAALAPCRRERYGPAELADLAWMLETGELKQSIEREDLYLPAFGGVQFVTRRPGWMEGSRVGVTAATLVDLSAHLIVAYLGRAYVAGAPADPSRPPADGERARGVAAALCAGDWRRLAELFDQSFADQQLFDPLLASRHTLAVVDGARAAGAWGVTATTTGPGGSLLVLCDRQQRGRVEAALRAGGARPLACAFEAHGVRAWIEGGEPS